MVSTYLTINQRSTFQANQHEIQVTETASILETGVTDRLAILTVLAVIIIIIIYVYLFFIWFFMFLYLFFLAIFCLFVLLIKVSCLIIY